MPSLDDILFQALGGGAKPDFAAGDPYAEPQKYVESALTAPILQSALKPDQGGYGTGELMGAALISGLLGGGLGGLSKDYQSEQQSLYKNALLGAALGQPVGSTEGLDPSLFDVAKQNASLFSVAEQLEKRKLARDVDAKKELLMYEAAGKNPYAAKKLAEAFSLIDSAREAKPLVSDASSETGRPAIIERDLLSPASKESRGVEGGILDEISSEAERLMEKGTDPDTAMVTAREAYKGKRAELDKQYERIQESAKAGQELRSLADQMEFYLGKAGNTGFGGDAAQFMAGMTGLVLPGQKEKYSAGQQLESLGTDVIKATGKVLKGPMSDADIRLLLRAGARLSNEESANAEIVQRWRYAGNLQDKYADFMREAQNSGMPVAKAEKAWSDLVKANPYLIRNQAGEMVPNANWLKTLSGEPNSEGGAPSARPSPSQFKTGAEYLQAYRAWEASQ